MKPQRRAEDGPRGTLTKAVMAIACPLAVTAIVWLFSSTNENRARLDKQYERILLHEYVLRYHGIAVPEGR